MTVTIERAREVFNLLTDIRVEAAIAAIRAGREEIAADAGHLLDDLFCLIRDAGLVPDVETHLHTVCELSLRYVEACVLTPTSRPMWEISTSNRVGLDRAVREIIGRSGRIDPSKPDTRHMLGYRLADIVWESAPTPIRTLPTVVFLSNREVRLAIAGPDTEMPDAVDAAFKARHPIPALSYDIETPASRQIEDADPPVR